MKIKIIAVAAFFIGIIPFSMNSITYKNPKVFTLTVQFPESIKQAPDIRAYHNGTRLTKEVGLTEQKVYFSMYDDRYRTEFVLLVIDPANLCAATTENNIQCYYVNPKSPYRLFSLKLKEKPIQRETHRTGEPNALPVDHIPSYCWEIKEIYFDRSNRIPDNAIIVFYDPEFVHTLSGGNIVEFPTIVIKDDLMKILGSQKALEEHSAALILGAIDFEPFHKPLEQHIQYVPNSSKTILALAA